LNKINLTSPNGLIPTPNSN